MRLLILCVTNDMDKKEYNRLKMAKYRAQLSEEQKKAIRERDNIKRQEKRKKWTIEDKEKEKKRFNKWYQKNKKEYIKRVTKKRDERLKNDIAFKLQFLCRKRLYKAIKAQNKTKLDKTMSLVGCTPNELKAYIESKFDGNMNWENYGSYWHIDHIKPCASFDLSNIEEQQKCFHYTNLQPLEAKENMRKGKREAPIIETSL